MGRAGASADPAEKQADEIGARVAASLPTTMRPGAVGGDVDRAMRPHVGLSLAGARVEADGRAHGRAVSERALAVTEGNTASFRDGAFDPGSRRGREVIGHELAHVAQQRMHGVHAKQHVKGTVEEQGLDKALESEKGMNAYLEKQARADAKVAKHLKDNPDTAKKEAERKAVRDDIERSIRLRAITLMAGHRAQVIQHRDLDLTELDANKRSSSDEAPAKKRSGQGKLGVMEGYRAAIKEEQKLKRVESDLKWLGPSARLVGAYARQDRLTKSLETLNASKKYLTSKQMLEAAGGLKNVFTLGALRSVLMSASIDLAVIRAKQMVGAVKARSKLYEAFPALASMQKKVTEVKPDTSGAEKGRITVEERPLTDKELDEAIRASYRKTLSNIAGAIERIATGAINPLDMPIPSKQVSGALKGEQREVYKEMTQNHKADQFWFNIGLPIMEAAIAVIPVVGPIAATAIGVAAAGIDLKEGLDSYALAEGTSNPLAHPLGVAPVGNFELALLAIGTILTAFEGVAIFKAIGGASAAPEAAEAFATAQKLRKGKGGDEAADAYLASYARQSRLDASAAQAKLSKTDASAELHDLAASGRLYGPKGKRRAEFGSGENKVVWEERGVGKWCRRRSPCDPHDISIPDGPSGAAETPTEWVREMRARIDTIPLSKRAKISDDFESRVAGWRSRPDVVDERMLAHWEAKINKALPKGIIPARYQPGKVDINLNSLDPATRKRAEDLLEKRRNAKTTEEKIRISELLGEIAAVGMVHKRYPGPPKPTLIYPPKLADETAARTGRDRFDAVYEVTLPDGTKHHVVVEAKGHMSKEPTKGTRDVGGGKRAEQGTREYFDTTLVQMKKACTKDPANKVCDAVKALENKQLGTGVSYEQASFRIDADGNFVSISGQKYDTSKPPPTP